MAMIEFSHVDKYYGKFQALKDINLEISQGEVVVIIGPSGSGKSTLIRTINGLEEIESGRLVVNGLNLADKKTNLNELRRNVGMVFQHFNLYANKTVLENIMLAPRLVLKRDEAENKRLAMELLETVGLAEKANSYPRQLSGGQKQRLSIARGVVGQPPILILDDSTSALDAKSEKLVQEALAKHLQNTTTFIIAEKIVSVLKADQILVLDQGRLVAKGTHQELLVSSPLYQEIYASQKDKERMVAVDD